MKNFTKAIYVFMFVFALALTATSCTSSDVVEGVEDLTSQENAIDKDEVKESDI